MDNALNQNPPVKIAVDNEHGALRFVIVIIFIIGWLISYIVLNTAIPNEGLNLIAIIISFGITALITQQIEKALKKRWPSGRTVQIDQHTIKIVDKDGKQQSIDGDKQVNIHMWRFTIKRRSRVPKGWFMLACALEQDDAYLPVYTFMSPEQFDTLKNNSRFTTLVSQKEANKSTGLGQTDLRLAGEQRRLHTAENARWMNGAEMSAEDFQNFIKQLQIQFPQWMPSVL
jgi:hypothetical protein